MDTNNLFPLFIMTKRVICYLVIPLGLLTLIFFFLSKPFSNSYDSSGLFINLSTDFLMVIITVSYIDYVIRKNEDDRWKSVREHLKKRLDAGIFESINKIYCRFDPEYGKNGNFFESLVIPKYLEKIKLLLSSDEFSKNLSNLEESQWDEISLNISVIRREFVQILTIYSNYMSPEQISIISEIESSLMDILEERRNYKNLMKYFSTGIVKADDFILQEVSFYDMNKSLISLLLSELFSNLYALYFSLE